MVSVGNKLAQRCQSSRRNHKNSASVARAAAVPNSGRFSLQERAHLALLGKGMSHASEGLEDHPPRPRHSITCASASLHLDAALAPSTGKARKHQQTSISRAWLNNMVPNLVKKLNQQGRGVGRGVTMAFVCNDVMQEPLTEVDSTTGDDSFEDWNVISEPSRHDAGEGFGRNSRGYAALR